MKIDFRQMISLPHEGVCLVTLIPKPEKNWRWDHFYVIFDVLQQLG